MNSRTSKLLHSYARCSGTSLNDAKREWNRTPATKRGEVRTAMESGIWSSQLRDWRKQHKLLQKDAWDILQVPEHTYRGWEDMRRTPPKHVRVALGLVMRNYVKSQ